MKSKKRVYRINFPFSCEAFSSRIYISYLIVRRASKGKDKENLSRESGEYDKFNDQMKHIVHRMEFVPYLDTVKNSGR